MSSPLTCDLVIPALNERPTIDPLFDALAPLADAGLRHVVVGDNGSTDGTGDAAAARGAVVVHETQRGYGAACLRAVAWIETQSVPPDVIAFLDADLADDPAELPRLLAPIARGEADIVIGSRTRHACPGSMNPVQHFGNWLACTLIRIFGGRQYTDLGPFRAIRWTTFRRLEMADRTWGWTVELQMKAALLGIPSTEIDVPYRPRHAGKSKITGTVRGCLAAGTRIIATILMLWWRRGTLRRQDAAQPSQVVP